MRSCYCVLIFFVLTSALYGSEENQEPISIAFVGDIFLGNWAVESLDTAGYDYPFRGCLEIFRSANLVVGNLESPLTQSNEPYIEKQFLLKSPIGVGEALYNANIRAVTLANNHILDYGVGAMKETFKQLQRYNIQYFGAGLNKEEALKEASFYFEGITFAIIGFSATFPEEFWATDSSAGTAFPYDEDIKRTIRRLSDLYDVTIVSFHWGAEKIEYPKDYQVDLAHLSIDLGADMVIGHHPHVVQGVELYKNKPIFYSLGNFAFASYSETAKTGLMVIANFVGANIESIRAIPLNVYNVQVEFQPQPIAIPKVTLPLDHLSNISLTLNQDRDIVGPDGYIAIPSE